MKHPVLVAGLLAFTLVASGCQWLPQRTTAFASDDAQCLSDIPTLEEQACLLDAWVAFGLAAQRGGPEWRRQTLEKVDGDTTRDRLARAVVFSWSGRGDWKAASELYKADLAMAPSRLQPLLRQWLNGLEARRSLVEEIDDSEHQRQALARERDSLAKKLDALTEIEESINSRQQ
ncbi:MULTISPECIES: hypothetical protein [Modicisalibacter]|uniref:YfhG lipoprotein n=1 Tax=Modicisalibacter tunisiensis TaxID=390637 RepID=A0ABS7WUT8_9GAMM|nr:MULTISPECIES: hypothetical protein [Modicisalibacter]KXS38922.1 MAG: hypothetical protein AWU55_1017 [Halomonadaceae bacterium T82-2]MBZ9566383.1 hypothetical protein [Modicisalibacter tunisiensis]